MRYVDRSTTTAPTSLMSEDCAGVTEYRKAKAYYAQVPAPDKAYPFKAYKGDEVKQALRNLFHGKCAYCESRYEAGQPVDVEHYRPKGGIQERHDHRGYWWLAADWNNLLPSCIDCNRRRGQVSAPLGMSLTELEAALSSVGDTEPVGKQNSFPTLNATWADPETDPNTIESPALIDPTRSDPKNHLVWPHAEVSVVLPRIDSHGNECPRATASIHIYALNRLGLVQSRLEIRQKLDAHIQSIRKLARNSMKLNGDDREEAMKDLDDEIIALRTQAGAKHIFSAMVGARLAAFEAELQEILTAG
ncbi:MULTISPECIES: HNH endonuclease [unclassified Rhizobium]|uniref:HNH endonuclease n=1 Tax=unclassified Rhizobium TaxID=2613769 RepID=UPI00177CF4D2|nr:MULTISPECIES: HNH endonuclease [unclassified Rhizobium]MBD8689602.1 HNH endonuclease [Rhizobium sp. CFBP 13644]MBD8694209.1 HNH endonuclease [Rhizobium sp. CFBP 13717]